MDERSAALRGARLREHERLLDRATAQLDERAEPLDRHDLRDGGVPRDEHLASDARDPRGFSDRARVIARARRDQPPACLLAQRSELRERAAELEGARNL